jgi:hypothetical protein
VEFLETQEIGDRGMRQLIKQEKKGLETEEDINCCINTQVVLSIEDRNKVVKS